MRLITGARLGPYEVVAPLGRGGMGEVYRATDTTLDREVAIKVLAADFAQDVDHFERFRREARLLASLNHPHIATIYGLEQSGGEVFLAMELVAGPTLREMKRPSVQRAVEIARQIADALQAAHEKGVVHRDLKPANVKIAADGQVKVLDFGLAKSVAADVGGDAVTGAVTEAGTPMGTPGYMSPEQVKGERTDPRTDTWALGCVLYELLTGLQAFRGKTVAEAVTATLALEPDWAALPEETPIAVRKVVRRCLAKDPGRRYQCIGDVRLDLDEAFEAATPAVRGGRNRIWLATVGLVGLAAVAGVWYAGQAARVPPQQWSGELLVPSRAIGPRISPDGRTLAFQAWINTQNQVAVLTPSSGSWNVLTDEQADGSIMGMSWSPDGSRIYYDRFGNGIFSVPVVGGEPRRILDNGLGPEVLPDGSLLFTRVNEQRQNQLHRLWPNDQRIEPLPALLPPTAEAWAPPVRVFPDGNDAVFLGRPVQTPEASNQLHAIDLVSNRVRRLAPALTIRPAADYFALSVSPSGESALVDFPEGDLHHILEVPRDGRNETRRLLTLTNVPWFLDASRDGSIYVDQISRPFVILRFPVSGGTPEQLARSPAFYNYYRGGALPLPDARVLVASRTAGRERLLVTGRNGMLLPFVETTEETSGPTAILSDREIAFLEGSGSNRHVAVAVVPDDRIVRRIRPPAGDITALAASSDGRTIYAVISKAIWAIPAQAGAEADARPVAEGDGVAVDPTSGDLIVQVFAVDGSYRLYRHPMKGGPPREIPFSGSSFVTYPIPLSPNAVGRDGRILVHGGAMDTWNFRIGVVDPVRQTVHVVPLQFDGDPAVPGWSRDGRIVSIGLQYRQNLWRFRPVAPARDRRVARATAIIGAEPSPANKAMEPTPRRATLAPPFGSVHRDSRGAAHAQR
jgi:eukaryotic-like serine/threonine-protein kinase